jgi:hypothetical protein
VLDRAAVAAGVTVNHWGQLEVRAVDTAGEPAVAEQVFGEWEPAYAAPRPAAVVTPVP